MLRAFIAIGSSVSSHSSVPSHGVSLAMPCPVTVALMPYCATRTVPPLQRRSRAEFQTLFNQIWEELDVNA